MNALSSSNRFSTPKPSGVTPISLVSSVDTVTQLHSDSVSQLPSIPVTKYIPRGSEGRDGVEIQSALPKTWKEAEELDTIYKGPIWRLVGNLLEFEAKNKPLSDEETLSLLTQYGQAYRFLCDQIKITSVSQAAIEDTFYDQRRMRKVPAGVHPVKWAADKARNEPLPPEAKRYVDDEPRRLLVAVCWHLSALKGDHKPFSLSCRDLEKHLGFYGHAKWATILQQLCNARSPILREVSKGQQFTPNGPQASEYEYLLQADS